MKVLGINAGNGVVLYPFQKSKHFEVLGNIESRAVFHTKMNRQWYLNFDSPMLRGSLDPSLEPDVIVGAPDCGHSSIFGLSRGKKFKDPKDNKSMQLFFEAIELYQPEYFLMENLPRLLITIEDIDSYFPGYTLKKIVGSVSQFGNSQLSRKRLVLIGVKNKKQVRYFKLKDKDYHLKLVNELEADLNYPDAALCHIREPEDTIIAIHGGCKLSLKEIRETWEGKLAGKKKWVANHKNLKNAPGVYRNLGDQYPLTARKALRQFNTKGYPMTPRELARIQGIPDDFILWFDENDTNYTLNKARVTVGKSPCYEIFNWFKKRLIKIQKNG